MDQILTIRECALALYGSDSKAKRNTLARMCADGTIANAEKCGSHWYINATREWPGLFGEVDPGEPERGTAAVPTALSGVTSETTVGELFAMLAQVARG